MFSIMEKKYLCKIVATVPTGLEVGAGDECKETLEAEEIDVIRGRVSFQLQSLAELKKVDNLRSIDNYFVIVSELSGYCKEESSVLERLEQLPSDIDTIDWDTPLSVWRHYHELIGVGGDTCCENEQNVLDEFESKLQLGATSEPSGHPPSINNSSEHTQVSTSSEEHPQTTTSSEDATISEEHLQVVTSSSQAVTSTKGSDTVPQAAGQSTLANDTKKDQLTFRVTCTRGGRQHCFTSMEAAAVLGAGLARRFGWKVQMKNADIEVLLFITGDDIVIGIALNKESKFKRNISHFGPTTLRSTIAHGLLRYATIQPGEVVLDPMCGSGAISIEGSLAWPLSFHMAGDNHKLAPPRTQANITALTMSEAMLSSALKVDVVRWDVCNLPLRTASVDVTVTDLPFGKKSGNRRMNFDLYPALLQEVGRVSQPSTARAVLLTHHHKALSRALLSDSLWKRRQTRWVNIGGLTAAIYILHRSSKTFNAVN